MVVYLVCSTCILNLMSGQELQRLREQLRVPGSGLERSELLTSEFRKFLLRLNETSSGLGKIGAVSGSDCKNLKLLRTAFLADKLLGWKVKAGFHFGEFGRPCFYSSYKIACSEY